MRSASIEALESRRLMSVSLAADGTLSVGGTHQHNVIYVRRAGGGKIGLYKSAFDPDPLKFDAAKVKRISISASGGPDELVVQDALPIPVTVDCGRGDDVDDPSQPLMF